MPASQRPRSRGSSRSKKIQSRRPVALVLGGIQEDVRLQVPDTRVHAATEGLRICLPAREKNLARGAIRTYGGGGFNVAVGLSRLGLATTLLAAVGDDTSGRHVEQRLKKEKVRAGLAKKPGFNSGLSVILNAAETDAILEDRGANNALDLNDAEPVFSKTYDLLYISHLSGASDALLFEILGLVGAGIFFWNPGTTQIQKGVRGYRLVLRGGPVVILNHVELMTWFKKRNPSTDDYHAAAKKVLQLGAQALAVTRGTGGADLWAYVPSANRRQVSLWHVPAVRIGVVDRLGGGDAFASAFAAYLVRTGNLCNAAIAGVVNAAATLTEPGATEGLLTWQPLVTKVRALTKH